MDRSDFDLAFDATFGFVAFALNRHLTHHMLRCSRVLGVDYETLVIWGVLAHQNVAHLVAQGASQTEVTRKRGMISAHDDELRPLRLRDLQQITGIPRETLRRKLNGLAKRGFVRHVDRCGWILERNSLEPDLREFTRESVKQFLACAARIQTMLDAAMPAMRTTSGPASDEGNTHPSATRVRSPRRPVSRHPK